MKHAIIEGLPVPFTVEARGYRTRCHVFAGRAEARGGYGQIRRRGKNRLAHKAAWEQQHGPVPAGRELDHLCRVRRCIRTDHLEPVTSSGNRRRGLLPKLTMEKAIEIRAARAAGESQRALAGRYGVSRACVRQLLDGRTWRA